MGEAHLAPSVRGFGLAYRTPQRADLSPASAMPWKIPRRLAGHKNWPQLRWGHDAYLLVHQVRSMFRAIAAEAPTKRGLTLSPPRSQIGSGALRKPKLLSLLRPIKR